MAECIIARGGGTPNQDINIPVISDRSSVVVTVTDNDGVPISDLSVHCKDGDSWYNYHTNNKGQVLFMTNSGSANITAWNFSINGKYKWIDMKEVNKNLDTPIGSIIQNNISLPWYNNFRATATTTNIYNTHCYNFNYKFRHYTHVNAFIGGGGGFGGNGTASAMQL